MPAVVLATPNIHVELHPFARSAYEWCMQYPQWIRWSDLPEPITIGLSKEPLRGIMMKSDSSSKGQKSVRHFQLFSPLWTTQLWSSAQPPDGTLLISFRAQDMPHEEIEHAAWLSALTPFLLSVDHHKVAEIRDSLAAHMSVRMHRKLLNSKTLSDPMLCRWLGVSRGTLVQQRQKKTAQEEQAKTGIPRSTDELIAALQKPRSPDD